MCIGLDPDAAVARSADCEDDRAVEVRLDGHREDHTDVLEVAAGLAVPELRLAVAILDRLVDPVGVQLHVEEGLTASSKAATEVEEDHSTQQAHMFEGVHQAEVQLGLPEAGQSVRFEARLSAT